ncbi:hypothetical protein UCDDA912_g06993 [Diaporthe ampelina]|uniref:Uncharacterized protein n=1 Tax=Diaporthe ampelina TaxID=1214573 RepID=A0A0G2HCY4_9PEZI|nr:hypothetical protein UCDDA912_g06993 [Diaporthe ampelina]
MNPSQQFCWGSRTVIYISELPHYLHVPEMVLHHLLTLLGMSVVAKFNISRRGLDLSLAALWSEIVYSLRNILKWTGHLDTRPNLDWRLTFYGTLFLFVTRAPTTIMALAMIPANGLQAGPALVIACAYGFHLVYIIRITYIRLKKSGVLQVEDSGVFRVRAGDRLSITSTTLLTGMAFMSTQISLLLLYSWTNTGLEPVGTPELINLTWSSLVAGIIGLAGSRLIAGFLQVFFQWHWISLLCMQLDLAITASVLCLSPSVESSMKRRNLLFCFLLSSSLIKAISQYASHLSCIQSKPQGSSRQLSSSRRTLNCSIINLGQYFFFVLLFATGHSSLARAALNSSLVQLVVEAAANSTMTKATTCFSLGSVAALMSVWRSSLIEISNPVYRFELYDNQTINSLLFSRGPSSLPHWAKFLLQDTFIVGVLYVLFSTTMDYLCNLSWKIPKMPGFLRLRTIGLVTVSAWIGYIVYLVSTGQTPEIHNKNFTATEILAREPPMCSLLLSWNFWAALSASAIVPTAIAHLWQQKVVAQKDMPGEVVLG